MHKPLNLTDLERLDVLVTYNLNHFEVYHASGWLMASASNKEELRSLLTQNQIIGAKFDSAAQRKYL